MTPFFNRLLSACALLALLTACSGDTTVNPEPSQTATGPSFHIRFDPSLGDAPQDGRLLLLLSNTDRDEPRFLVDNSLDTQLVYGRNVWDWSAGADMLIDAAHIGFPINTLADLPPGRYYVQALLNRYKDFTLSNGKTVSLSPDQGEGQQWNRKPGNFYSEPVALDITADGEYEIVMDQQVDPIEPAEDTKFIKHVRMKSELLSEFWGEDVYLGAHVLLPRGFEEHPEAL